MSRLLLEIYPEHRPGVAGAADLPAVLISTRAENGGFAPEAAGATGQMVVLRLQNGGCVLQCPPEHPNQPLGLGQWHEADGWKVRVTHAVANAQMSVSDNPSWAAPEIRITTYDGDRVKRLRCMLPVEEESQLVVGRGGPGADLIIEDEHVSRVHMRFFMKDGRRMAEDMGSRWGTRLNGAALTDPQPLKHGDEVRLGKSTIHYICYWDLLPQNQAGSAAPAPISVDGGTGDEAGAAAAAAVATAEAGAAAAPEIVEPAPPAAPSPPPEVKPAPPKPSKRPKEKPAAVRDKKPAPPPPKPKVKRNYLGFDVGGAILIVLALIAGMVYLAYLVFKH
ncbi:MAG TPA: FHA domain-containing protein [Tepidisphaeraceae bacterium]